MVYGFGIYDGDFEGKNSTNKIYQVWRGMIKRCYSPKSLSSQPSYIGTTVSDEWIYYSNFEKWYHTNYIDGYFLDKDIISGSSQLYSPETCAFVPREINNSILEGRSPHTQYPLGVSYHTKKKSMINEYKKPFYAQLTKNGTSHSLGSFETSYEAHVAWQHAKIEYFYYLIDKYKGKVVECVIAGLERRIEILKNDIFNTAITKTINKI